VQGNGRGPEYDLGTYLERLRKSMKIAFRIATPEYKTSVMALS
jgi:hypothetical protein